MTPKITIMTPKKGSDLIISQSKSNPNKIFKINKVVMTYMNVISFSLFRLRHGCRYACQANLILEIGSVSSYT